MSNVRGYLQIPNLENDQSLYPVWTGIYQQGENFSLVGLMMYRTGFQTSTFLDICRLLPSAESTAPASICLWYPLAGLSQLLPEPSGCLKYLALAGVNTSIFQQHSTLPVWQLPPIWSMKSLTVKQICNIACWTSISGIFEKFYARY